MLSPGPSYFVLYFAAARWKANVGSIGLDLVDGGPCLVDRQFAHHNSSNAKSSGQHPLGSSGHEFDLGPCMVVWNERVGTLVFVQRPDVGNLRSEMLQTKLEICIPCRVRVSGSVGATYV